MIRIRARRPATAASAAHATLDQLDHLPGDSDEEHDPRRLVGSDEEYNDKDDEAAQLAAELDETMSRSGSEWSNLVWWGDNQSDIDLREYELRRVSGFTFARPRVAIDRAKESMRSAVVRVKATARDKRAKASAFVDRRKQRLWSGLHSVDERREVALRVIQRAAREKKHALAMRAAGAGRSTKAALRHAGGSSKAALRHGVDIVAGTAEAALDKAVAARDVMAEKREVARKVLSKNLVRWRQRHEARREGSDVARADGRDGSMLSRRSFVRPAFKLPRPQSTETSESRYGKGAVLSTDTSEVARNGKGAVLSTESTESSSPPGGAALTDKPHMTRRVGLPATAAAVQAGDATGAAAGASAGAVAGAAALNTAPLPIPVTSPVVIRRGSRRPMWAGTSPVEARVVGTRAPAASTRAPVAKAVVEVVATVADTLPPDTAAPDAAPPDAAPPDTAPPDTAPPGTAPLDSRRSWYEWAIGSAGSAVSGSSSSSSAAAEEVRAPAATTSAEEAGGSDDKTAAAASEAEAEAAAAAAALPYKAGEAMPGPVPWSTPPPPSPTTAPPQSPTTAPPQSPTTAHSHRSSALVSPAESEDDESMESKVR
jgi:hypothetical protein